MMSSQVFQKGNCRTRLVLIVAELLGLALLGMVLLRSMHDECVDVLADPSHSLKRSSSSNLKGAAHFSNVGNIKQSGGAHRGWTNFSSTKGSVRDALAKPVKPHAPPAHDTTVEEKMSYGSYGGRVAICVTGQPRTLNMTTTDPHFPPTWGDMGGVSGVPADGGKVSDSIQQKLFTTLEEQGFDVFMHVSTPKHSEALHQEDNVRYPQPGETAACEPLRPHNASNRLFCNVQLEESDLAPALPKTFRKYQLNSPIKNVQLLHQLRDQLLCMQQVEAQGGSETYSHIIRLRPDFQMIEPFPSLRTLDFGQQLGEPKILYHAKQNCCCGNEDSFGVGLYEVMRAYLSRYNTLQSLPTDTIEEMMDFEDVWNSEIFVIGEVARVANATMQGHEGINGCTVKLANRSDVGAE